MRILRPYIHIAMVTIRNVYSDTLLRKKLDNKSLWTKCSMKNNSKHVETLKIF